MTVTWIPRGTFADRLRQVRLHVGLEEGRGKPLSVEEAARRCDLNAATWSTWENGKQPRGLNDVVEKIQEGLGADKFWLAFGDERRANPTQPPGRHEHGGTTDQEKAGSPCTEPLAA